MKQITSLLIALFSIATISHSQDFEGKISMNIIIDVPEEMQAMPGMFPTTAVNYVKGASSRMESTGGMMNQTVISNAEDKKVIILMDMMGQKMAMVSDMEEPESADEEKVRESIKVEYTSETKTIAGYKCEKAIVTLQGETPEETFTQEVWYTTEIANSNRDFGLLKGLPLEYSMNISGMKMTFSTTEIKRQAVDSSMFKVPEGYTITSPDQMGGMFQTLPPRE